MKTNNSIDEWPDQLYSAPEGYQFDGLATEQQANDFIKFIQTEYPDEEIESWASNSLQVYDAQHAYYEGRFIHDGGFRNMRRLILLVARDGDEYSVRTFYDPANATIPPLEEV